MPGQIINQDKIVRKDEISDVGKKSSVMVQMSRVFQTRVACGIGSGQQLYLDYRVMVGL